MNFPFFSVVIPTHNRSSLLKRAVDSVLCQTYDNFELIIVDDHSTDATSQTAKSYSDRRIKYMLNQRSKGACGARNTGIYAAIGEWVAFLDDDDIWYSDKLKQQYELILKSKNSVGLICSDYAIHKGENKKLKVVKNRPSGWIGDKLLYGGIGCLSSVCVRTEILRDIEGFDECFPSDQDQDLWLRVAELSEFANVPKTLVNMYQEDRKDRIGQNTKSKLEGCILLRNKYSAQINKSLRLRNHYESRIFIYAFIENNRPILAKCLPWVFLGALIDFPYFIRTIGVTIILAYRKKTQTQLYL